MYMYTYIHTHTHTYIYIYIYIYIYTHTHIYINMVNFMQLLLFNNNDKIFCNWVNKHIKLNILS